MRTNNEGRLIRNKQRARKSDQQNTPILYRSMVVATNKLLFDVQVPSRQSRLRTARHTVPTGVSSELLIQT